MGKTAGSGESQNTFTNQLTFTTRLGALTPSLRTSVQQLREAVTRENVHAVRPRLDPGFFAPLVPRLCREVWKCTKMKLVIFSLSSVRWIAK